MLPTLEVTNVEATKKKSLETQGEDASDKDPWKLHISDDILSKLQQEDEFCKNILGQIEKGVEKHIPPGEIPFSAIFRVFQKNI